MRRIGALLREKSASFVSPTGACLFYGVSLGLESYFFFLPPPPFILSRAPSAASAASPSCSPALWNTAAGMGFSLTLNRVSPRTCHDSQQTVREPC